MTDKDHYINKDKRFLRHCGFIEDDVWRLQSTDDYLTCLQYQSEDYDYTLTIKYSTLGWTLQALSNSSDKIRKTQNALIVTANNATLLQGIRTLAYRVNRDWNYTQHDNIISIQEWIEDYQQRCEGEK